MQSNEVVAIRLIYHLASGLQFSVKIEYKYVINYSISYLITRFSSCPLTILGSITRHDIDSPPVSERVVSIYKYEDIFMPSAAYQTFSSPFCLLLIVALTFYLLMGTP